jgi:small GTP-binding protein
MGIEFFRRKVRFGELIVNLKIWDTAGQEQFRSITRNFYKNSNGVLLVFDVTDRESFIQVRHWIEKVKDNSDPNVKMVLIGNKIDLDRTVSKEEGYQLEKELGISYFETSAKENFGVDEAFEHLVGDVLKDRLDGETRTSSTKEPFSLLTREESTPNSNKCPC